MVLERVAFAATFIAQTSQFTIRVSTSPPTLETMTQKHFLLLLLLVSVLTVCHSHDISTASTDQYRQLRGNDQDDEERGALSKLSPKLTAAKQKLKYKLWLTTRTKPENVLIELENAGVKMTETTLMAWVKYVVKCRDKVGASGDMAANGNLFHTLAEKLPGDKLATFLVSMRKDPKLESLSKELQTLQNARWIEEDVSPDRVKVMLKVNIQGKSEAQLRLDPAYNVWREYDSATIARAKWLYP